LFAVAANDAVFQQGFRLRATKEVVPISPWMLNRRSIRLSAFISIYVMIACLPTFVLLTFHGSTHVRFIHQAFQVCLGLTNGTVISLVDPLKATALLLEDYVLNLFA